MKEFNLGADISVENIRTVPSDVEIPVYNNPIQTRRALCSNFPRNRDIVRRIERDINTSNQTCINNIPKYIQELYAVYSSDQEECGNNVFDNQSYEVIDNISDLKNLLSELLIRFDTDPKFYTREDYSFLMAVLYKSLIFIYNNRETKEITLGDNLSQIAVAQDHLLDLKYPVAINPGDMIINEQQTLPSIAYLNKFVLRWEEF